MKFVYFSFISAFLISCSSIPKEYQTNDNICHYNDPIFKIKKEELTLDKEILTQLKKIKKDTVTINNKYFKNEFWYSKDEITNKQTNKQTNINKYLYYNNNGKIELSSFTYNNIYNLEKENHYNQQGNITKAIDYEKGYKICWAEAIEIVKQIAKKDIERYEIKDFYAVHNNLNEFPEVKAQWYIGFLNGNKKFSQHVNKKGYIRYVIDGVTGKFLKTTRVTKGKHLIYDEFGNVIN